MKRLLLILLLISSPVYAVQESKVVGAGIQEDSDANLDSLILTGTFTGAFTSISTATTLNSDYMVNCDASGGDVDVTLLTAVGKAGKMYYVKKIDGTHNACNMITTGTETIDGLDDGAKLSDPYISVGFVSDGTNWWTFIRRAAGVEIAPTMSNYSVIGAFTDWTSVERLAYRDGNYLQIQETAGNPAFQAWWTFPMINLPDKVIFRGCIYDGTNQHDVEAIIFSNASSAWHDLRINAVNQNPSESDFQHAPYTNEGIPYDRSYEVPFPHEDYVDSNGDVLVGIIHPELGSTADDWYCDSLHVLSH